MIMLDDPLLGINTGTTTGITVGEIGKTMGWMQTHQGRTCRYQGLINCQKQKYNDITNQDGAQARRVKGA